MCSNFTIGYGVQWYLEEDLLYCCLWTYSKQQVLFPGESELPLLWDQIHTTGQPKLLCQFPPEFSIPTLTTCLLFQGGNITFCIRWRHKTWAKKQRVDIPERLHISPFFCAKFRINVKEKNGLHVPYFVEVMVTKNQRFFYHISTWS